MSEGFLQQTCLGCQDICVKAVLLGESTVGKSSIIEVVRFGHISEEQAPTIGACFHAKRNKIGDQIVKVNLWDTAGQERFRSLAPMFYRDADFAVLVYSIDNPISFDSLESWYSNLQHDCQTIPEIIVVGNKSDLESKRKVQKEQGEQFSKKIGAVFFEISAKENPNRIDDIINSICEIAIRNKKTCDEEQREGPPLKENKKSCC